VSCRARIVSIEGSDDRGLAPWQARALAAQLLAAALVEAADEIDGLAAQ
jgi:hypothetical protein